MSSVFFLELRGSVRFAVWGSKTEPNQTVVMHNTIQGFFFLKLNIDSGPNEKEKKGTQPNGPKRVNANEEEKKRNPAKKEGSKQRHRNSKAIERDSNPNSFFFLTSSRSHTRESVVAR